MPFRRALLLAAVVTFPILHLLNIFPVHIPSVLYGILLSVYLTDSLPWDLLRAATNTLPPPYTDDANSDEAAAGRLSVQPRQLQYSYGLDHALLNLRIDSLWLNMGFWKDTTEFPEACRALAKLVADNARIENGCRIMDFGYGCGDQDLFICDSYPPSTVVGVTSERIQARVAHRRIEKAGYADRVHLYVGDAIDPSTWRSVLKDASPPSDLVSDGRFDAVMSLDSCYHYKTRFSFFALASSLLRPGGRLSCTDIILGSGNMSAATRLSLRAGLAVAGVPWENIVSETDYKKSAKEAGFSEVDVEDISENVFPGLRNFLHRQRADVGGLVDTNRKWRQYMGTSKLLSWVHKNKLLRFVLVSARKQ
ncbi:hypothetical protein HK104_000217 [Borealophlyctis nickersoniae]|nr:hypothetical protein HK104_000217 [Borealophlyctis nickersoniae]